MIIQLGNFGGGGGGSVDPSVLSGYCNGGQYNASTQKIELLHDSNVIARIDASSFVIDGMVEDVYLSGTTLVIEFNTAAGKQNIEVPLSSIFDPSNYYTKSEVDTELAKKQPVSGMTAYTQDANFAAHSGNTSMHTTAQEKAAWDAKQDASAMTNYYTSAQTQSAISGAVLTKQDTLVSGTNIKTINNESLLGSGNITISGGGSSNIVELTQAQYDSLATKDPDTLYIITDAQAINMNDYWTSAQTSSAITQAVSGYQPITGMSAYTQQSDFAAHSGNTGIHTTTAEKAVWNGKQDALVSGTNIKTINNQSLLGSGNINISGGSGSYVYYSEDTEAKTATIHIEDTDGGTVGELLVDGGSVDMYASMTEEDEDNGSIVETHSEINGNSAGIAMAYEKNIDDAEATHSYLNVEENNISLQVSSDEDHTTTFAVSNSAVTINGENVVTEDQLADYQPLLSAGTGIDITDNVISATGGGGATYSAGTNISIDTANTINCTLNLTNGTGNNSIKAKGNSTAGGVLSFSFGDNTEAPKAYEIAFGVYNKTRYGDYLWGNSGNSLFTLGNGANGSNKHNALEIRQNGDLYFADTDNTTYPNYYQKPMVRLQDMYGALGGLKFVRLTQAQYDALVTKDADTMYIIVSGS